MTHTCKSITQVTEAADLLQVQGKPSIQRKATSQTQKKKVKLGYWEPIVSETFQKMSSRF